MAKKMTITMPTQAEFVSKTRRTCGVDGSLNGGTKVQSNKGKKPYNRRKANNPKNW